MMKHTNLLKSTICILLFMVFSGVASAERLPDTFLWKIEKEGAPVSYLLGTAHFGIKGATLPENYVTLMKSCGVLMTETDMFPDNNRQLEIAKLMLGKKPLSQIIGGDLMAKLAAETGRPAASLEGLKPWAALTLVMYIVPDGYSLFYGVDMLLSRKAKSEKLERIFLEAPEDVLSTLSSLPEEKIVNIISYYLNNTATVKDETEHLLSLYYADKVTGMLAFVDEADDKAAGIPGYEETAIWMESELLVKRTAHWMPEIKKQINSRPVFIAVGAMHLYEEDGIIALLRKSGYHLTPIMPKK